MTADLEDRLRLLEAHIDVQEQILMAIQAERIEADRLEASVGRLGENTSALSAALLLVDKNQQQLTKLGRQITAVEETSATKVDLVKAAKEQARVTREFRKTTLARIYTTGILLILFLAGGSVAVAQYQQNHRDVAVVTCQDRNEQNQIIIDILEGSVQAAPNGPGTENIRAGLARFQALIVDCEKL